jgi:hypothetical protein
VSQTFTDRITVIEEAEVCVCIHWENVLAVRAGREEELTIWEQKQEEELELSCWGDKTGDEPGYNAKTEYVHTSASATRSGAQ